MQAKVDKLEKGRIKITITLEPKEMVVYFKKSYDKVAPTIKIDGFRAGKAPRKVIESAAGIARLLSEGLDAAVSEAYFQTIQNEKIIPITQPKIVINKYPSYGHTEEEVRDGFEFEAELDILPEVILGDYSKIKIEVGEPEKAKDEDVEKVLKHFQKQNADFIEVKREAKVGDFAEISYEGFVDHVKKDAMCSKNHPLILGEKSLIPGFEDKLVGLKEGEKTEFDITFPKDYHAKEFAGKKATFKVEVNKIKEVKLPELNDEFAKKYGHEKFSELRAAIEESLNLELKQNHRRDLEGKILDKMLPLLKVDVPDVLIDREVDRMIADFGSQIVAQGGNFDRYLESIKKTREDLAKDMRPGAEKNVRVGMLLGKIIEQNDWDQHDPKIGEKALQYLIDQFTQKPKA